MQPQGDIGIFRGIGSGLLQRDLVEGDLRRALACHISEFNGFFAQVFQSQTVHIVASCHRVQHIGFQHGVKGNSLQFDTLAGQHTHIVFEILSHLGNGSILETGFDFFQHQIPGQLFRCSHIVVAKGNIGGLPRGDRQGDANQFCGHIVQAGGLRIHSDQRRRFYLLDPEIKIPLG